MRYVILKYFITNDRKHWQKLLHVAFYLSYSLYVFRILKLTARINNQNYFVRIFNTKLLNNRTSWYALVACELQTNIHDYFWMSIRYCSARRYY